MNHRDNDSGGDYNNVDIEADPTPFPPMTSCIAAMGMLLLVIVMSSVVTLVSMFVAIFCSFTIILIEHWFRGDALEMEHMEDFELVDGGVEADEKAVKFLKAFFRAAVKGKKVEGTIECFGSEEMAELGYSECSICMDEFQKGDKCLVFPGCGHIFHCKCIARWLKKKLTCPVCRSSVAANANGTGGFKRPWRWWVQP